MLDGCAGRVRDALTEAGYKRLQAASPTHMRGVDEHFLSAIPSEDRAAFVRVLSDILEGLARAGRSGDEACADDDEASDPRCPGGTFLD